MGFLIKVKGKKIHELEFVLETAVENIIDGFILSYNISRYKT